MEKEIERRFLVKTERLPKLSRGQEITQGYISTDPAVRVRTVGKKAYLTIKFGSTPVREEFEMKIPSTEAAQLLAKTKYKIEKTRYKIEINEATWELDFFLKENKGLVIAEIELLALNQEIEKPLWLGKEITNEEKYLNVNLAQKPFISW